MTFREKAECALCHNRIDPLGFGFEDFDPLGRWRTEQGGQPIDSAGKLPTGEEFNGPVELKITFLGSRASVARVGDAVAAAAAGLCELTHDAP